MINSHDKFSETKSTNKAVRDTIIFLLYSSIMFIILEYNVHYTWVYWNNETNNAKSSSTRDYIINNYL